VGLRRGELLRPGGPVRTVVALCAVPGSHRKTVAPAANRRKATLVVARVVPAELANLPLRTLYLRWRGREGDQIFLLNDGSAE